MKKTYSIVSAKDFVTGIPFLHISLDNNINRLSFKLKYLLTIVPTAAMSDTSIICVKKCICPQTGADHQNAQLDIQKRLFN